MSENSVIDQIACALGLEIEYWIHPQEGVIAVIAEIERRSAENAALREVLESLLGPLQADIDYGICTQPFETLVNEARAALAASDEGRNNDRVD